MTHVNLKHNPVRKDLNEYLKMIRSNVPLLQELDDVESDDRTQIFNQIIQDARSK